MTIQTLPFWAYIAVDNDPASTAYNEERVCAAIVGLPDLLAKEPTDKLLLNDLLYFPFDPEAVAKQIVAQAIRAGYISKEHYKQFIASWQLEQNRTFVARPDRRGSIPSLLYRDPQKEFISEQQQNLMKPILAAKRLIFADHITKKQKARVENWGKSIDAAAVAGGVEVALEKFTLEQKMAAVDPRAPIRWMGIPRWNEDLLTEKEKKNY